MAAAAAAAAAVGSVGAPVPVPPYGLGSAAAAAAAAAASTSGLQAPVCHRKHHRPGLQGRAAGGQAALGVGHATWVAVPGQLGNVVGSVWPHVGVMDSVAAAAAAAAAAGVPVGPEYGAFGVPVRPCATRQAEASPRCPCPSSRLALPPVAALPPALAVPGASQQPPAPSTVCPAAAASPAAPLMEPTAPGAAWRPKAALCLGAGALLGYPAGSHGQTPGPGPPAGEGEERPARSGTAGEPSLRGKEGI